MSLSIISYVLQSKSLKGQWRTRFKVVKSEFYGPCFAQRASYGTSAFPIRKVVENHNKKKAHSSREFDTRRKIQENHQVLHGIQMSCVIQITKKPSWFH